MKIGFEKQHHDLKTNVYFQWTEQFRDGKPPKLTRLRLSFMEDCNRFKLAETLEEAARQLRANDGPMIRHEDELFDCTEHEPLHQALMKAAGSGT